MASLDLVLKALDTAMWEMGEAFKGLPDANVWRRAHPRLLSVGVVYHFESERKTMSISSSMLQA